MASEEHPPTPTAAVADLIATARRGSGEALGQLLETCRNYLLMVANAELANDLQAKAGASDLVQETFLQAHQHFARFDGRTEAELLAWLRRILLNNLANFSRRYKETARRQVVREIALTDAPAGLRVEALPAAEPSPPTQLAGQERDAALLQALDQLPEDYRRVIQLRNYDGLAFEEIGRQLDRSAEAARKLWGRALARLNQVLGPADESP